MHNFSFITIIIKQARHLLFTLFKYSLLFIYLLSFLLKILFIFEDHFLINIILPFIIIFNSFDFYSILNNLIFI